MLHEQGHSMGAVLPNTPNTFLATKELYGDFELELEWTVGPGGNSGVMYRVTTEGEETYHTGPEMQVLDDAHHPDGRSRLTAAGAAYGLYPAPEGVVKPAGEWNRMEVVCSGDAFSITFNGKLVNKASKLNVTRGKILIQAEGAEIRARMPAEARTESVPQGSLLDAEPSAMWFPPRLRLRLEGFNLFDAEVSDIDYFYTSRLPGEPAAVPGVSSIRRRKKRRMSS